MIDSRNILGLILIICIAFYKLFGDVDDFYWCSFYFSVQNILVIWLSWLIMKFYRDKLLRIILKIIMGSVVAELGLNLYSFFDVRIFDKINRSYEAGGVIVGCIIIFLIYRRYGLVKR